jgi:tetratricopeptide (TPR) repeat protein/predicted Ser/Thr protein kinase
MPVAQGSRLGPYEIRAALGAGGMGEVYSALDTRLHRTVAVKVLPPAKFRDADREARFLQEARAASALNHPNIVTLHDIASDGDVHFLVMEYVTGETLSRVIQRNRLALSDVVEYATQMASALAAAHAAGIVHRDIKPANVIVTPERQMKILDFGLAKLQEQAASEDAETRPRRAELTEPGMVMGTVCYMSPEQARGEPVDGRTDLFSLGAVLYEMATGRRAFPRALDWTRPVSPAVRPDLDRIILKMIEPDRELRYQTAADVLVDLKRLRTSLTPDVSRRHWLWATGLVVVTAAAVSVGLWWRPQPARGSRLSDGNRPSTNREANDYYEKALLFGGGGIEDNGQRLRMLDRALALDPKFAAARAEYAFSDVAQLLVGDSNDPALFYKTEEQVRQALQDDPGCGRAHSVLGLTYLYQGRKELVLAELNEALKANSEDVTAYTWRLEYDHINGDYPQAASIAKQLIMRWPLYWPGHLYLADLLREQGDTTGAIKEAEASLEQDPTNLSTLVMLARAYLDRSELAKARQTLERVRPERRQNYHLRLGWSLLLALEGKRVEATREMNDQTQAYAALLPRWVLWGAEFYAVMGDTGSALEWLGKAVRAGDDRETWLQTDPLLASIRTHPDFQKLLESVAYRRKQRAAANSGNR